MIRLYGLLFLEWDECISINKRASFRFNIRRMLARPAGQCHVGRFESLVLFPKNLHHKLHVYSYQ